MPIHSSNLSFSASYLATPPTSHCTLLLAGYTWDSTVVSQELECHLCHVAAVTQDYNKGSTSVSWVNMWRQLMVPQPIELVSVGVRQGSQVPFTSLVPVPTAMGFDRSFWLCLTPSLRVPSYLRIKVTGGPFRCEGLKEAVPLCWGCSSVDRVQETIHIHLWS